VSWRQQVRERFARLRLLNDTSTRFPLLASLRENMGREFGVREVVSRIAGTFSIISR
jgi:hypothetical protein